MAHSRIIGDVTVPDNLRLWNNITISNTTWYQRNLLNTIRQDPFTHFMWRGADSFESFGCVIIADKRGDLKFYNGPQFSNEYSAPQYDSAAGNLLGVSFKQQTIQFKVGVYWITDADYRKFLEWLDPYEINYLSFAYNPSYSYLVKLASIDDSSRDIVGKENGNYVYYTELTLKWEVQGPSIGRSNTPIEWSTSISQDYKEISFGLNNSSEVKVTELKTPIVWNFRIKTASSSTPPTSLTLIGVVNNTQQLFNIQLKNLVWTSSSGNSNNEISPLDNGSSNTSYYYIHFRYDSEAGILYQSYNNTWKLVNLMTTTSEGKSMVNTSAVVKYSIPGSYNNINAVFKLTTTGGEFDKDNCNIISYARIRMI